MNKYCIIWLFDLCNKISWNYVKFIVIIEKYCKKNSVDDIIEGVYIKFK